MICSDFESIRKAHDHPPKLLASFDVHQEWSEFASIRPDQRGLQLHAPLNSHRIGWWENLQENPIFDGKNHGFL